MGWTLGGEKIAILLYADDVVLMAESDVDMQILLNIVDEFAADLDVKFSGNKCKVMGNYGVGPLRLGGSVLDIVASYPYLGVELGMNNDPAKKKSKLTLAENWVGIIRNTASFRVNTYEVIRELWKGLAVPEIMFGMEIIPWTKNDIDKLEVIQNKVGRKALGAPYYTATEAIRGDMGWSAFDERICKAKLKYKLRLELCPAANPLRRVYEWVGRGSFSRECTRIEKRYNITWGMGRVTRINGKNIQSYTQGCRWIDKLISGAGLDKWKSSANNKQTLRYYKYKEKPGKEKFYNGSWKSKALFRARTDSLDINARKRGQSADQHCNKCINTTNALESLEHVLLECDQYEAPRDIWINRVRGILGDEAWGELRDGDSDECMKVLLGFDKENETIIQATGDFLVKALSIRNREAPSVVHVEHPYARVAHSAPLHGAVGGGPPR